VRHESQIDVALVHQFEVRDELIVRTDPDPDAADRRLDDVLAAAASAQSEFQQAF
jgi:hypothetical protein